MTIKIIKDSLRNIPKSSGIYKYFDANNKILYVGKAKNLYNRISSYTRLRGLSPRISRMVSLVKKVEYIQTSSELEALLLENNLIKELLPRYNILLKDDKTFPEILITNHDFPQIKKLRAKNTNQKDGYHFGPFASGFDVIKTIEALRKIFKIRNCTDREFKSRKKPCLEYQIKKCSAPCVDLISQEEYLESIKQAKDFLKGKSSHVQEELRKKMLVNSQQQHYEKAAIIRDQIKSLDAIQAKQNINVTNLGDSDIFVIVTIGNLACIYVSFFRSGKNLGSKPYYYDFEKGTKPEDLLQQFLGQFYLSHVAPQSIFLNKKISDKNLMQDFINKLSHQLSEIILPQKGKKLAIIQSQEQIAIQNLERKISQNLSTKELLLELKKTFCLKKMPQKIEVYDNSHTGTTNAVGCMISAGIDGFIKSGYRKFNIRFEEEGKDDTAMMKEVMRRRFSKLKKDEYPDLIIIDGGKGQLRAVDEIFRDLKVKIPFIGMSKGENRNAGEEFFHQIHKDSFTLPKNSPLMYYLQRLRDEAHRFAIMTHRKRRSKDMIQ
ncbi:MAG: excinuclease ABC subunit UvrC [Rickettsiales bacterium]|nr:excinuclease ABC subunit UvrC [Rickettsiales bacterium]